MRRVVLALLVLAASSCVGSSSGRDDDGEPAGATSAPASPTSSSVERVRYENPSPRWIVFYPADWHLQPFQAGCAVTSSGAVVSNLDRDLAHILVDEPPECTFEWDLREVPGGFVAVEIARIVGGPPPPPSIGPDTELPLGIDTDHLPTLESQWVRPGMRGQTLRAIVNGDRGWHIRMWAGSSASNEDKSAAERIVGSLTFRFERSPTAAR